MRLGLYCGTFNPFHLGHLNIFEKAKKIFDDVRVAQGINPEKSDALQPLKVPPRIGIFSMQYQGLTTDLIKDLLKYPDYNSVTLVRGIRNGYDYDYEMNQIAVMRDLYPELNVVLIPCDPSYAHISSTMIRNLQKIKPEEAKRYLP